jgi:inorganic pyrophosphatase
MTKLAKLSHDLDPAEHTCRAVIETSKGNRSKFAYDPKAGVFELKKLLPDGMSFPVDFGFVPGTVAQDGDPLDVMVLHDEPLPMGAVVEVRLLGVIEAEQSEDGKTVRNDRLMAVSTASHLYKSLKRVQELGDSYMRNLEEFFVNYNRLDGKGFQIIRLGEPDDAIRCVKRAAKLAKAA